MIQKKMMFLILLTLVLATFNQYTFAETKTPKNPLKRTTEQKKVSGNTPKKASIEVKKPVQKVVNLKLDNSITTPNKDSNVSSVDQKVHEDYLTPGDYNIDIFMNGDSSTGNNIAFRGKFTISKDKNITAAVKTENEPNILDEYLPIIVIILIAFGSMVLIMILMNKSLEKKMRALISSSTKHQEEIATHRSVSRSVQTMPRQENTMNNGKFEEVMLRMADMEEHINKVRKEMREELLKVHGTLSQSKIDKEEVVPRKSNESSRSEHFYFGVPSNNGSFDESVRKEKPDGESYYLAKMSNHNSAVFMPNIEAKNAINDMINAPDLFLSPVCKIRNQRTDKVSRIKVLKSGTLKKEGTKWIMTSKAEIEYE